MISIVIINCYYRSLSDHFFSDQLPYNSAGHAFSRALQLGDSTAWQRQEYGKQFVLGVSCIANLYANNTNTNNESSNAIKDNNNEPNNNNSKAYLATWVSSFFYLIQIILH